MKPRIREAVPFGTGSHVVLEKGDIGNKFLIFPESSKYILSEVLKQYQEILEEQINPKLTEFLTKEEFETVKKCYERIIKKIDKVQHKMFLQDSFNRLKEMKVDEVATILNDIEDDLPKNVKKKLLKEYYRGK